MNPSTEVLQPNRDGRWAAALFFAFFALYLTSAAPQLAAYRDAGEMAVVSATLGVAHPPGYPLYTLLGHVAVELPLGNVVYRVNLLSGFAAAMCVALLFVLLRTWVGIFPSITAAVALGLSNPFWELAAVSEMYTLGGLFLVLILLSFFRAQKPELAALLFGLGLGARMDMLLLIPVFAFALWLQRWSRGTILRTAVFLAVGASVYLYLPIRSLQNPWMDWGNPETLPALIRSVTRASYSGTLDLLSKSYARGANFLPNLTLFLKNPFESSGLVLVPGALAGLLLVFRRDRVLGWVLALGLFITAPLFLYMANMPVNPHAVAVVEAAYVLPYVFLACLAGFGFSWVPAGGRQGAAALAAVLLLVPNARASWERASKRDSLYARDYATNAFRSLPPSAVAVFHEDVQLFSLWSEQLLFGRRRDLSLVSYGLGNSPWYWAMTQRWPVPTFPALPIRTTEDWTRFRDAARPRPLAGGFETDLNAPSPMGVQTRGLVNLIGGGDASLGVLPLTAFGIYRGSYVYEQTPDFFSTDLVADYARAFHEHALVALRTNELDRADRLLRRGEQLDPTDAQITADRAYLFYRQNKFTEADAAYVVAIDKFNRTLEKARVYNSLPPLVDQYRRSLAQCYTHRGVISEQAGRLDEARERYRASTRVIDNAQARYNLAVTYWEKDWSQVISNLKAAVALDPGMAQAQGFLLRAQAEAAKAKP